MDAGAKLKLGSAVARLTAKLAYAEQQVETKLETIYKKGGAR